MLYELYPDALDCGVPVEMFWDLSLAEISDIMGSFKRRRENQLKQDLINGFAFAQHTAELIGQYISEENQVHQLWDYFPELFAKEKKQHEAAEYEQQLETAKENRRAYAAELKRRREMGLS